MAHLSRDHRLIQVLNTGADIFRSIAAEWKMIELESVGDDLRQQAKQVILGNMLNINEENFNVSPQIFLAFSVICGQGVISPSLDLSKHSSEHIS